MSKHLLDDLRDGLSDEEQAVLSKLTELDMFSIEQALALRTGVKAQSLTAGLYLTDSSIDAITTALLRS
jgi:GAF domain-containing protein